MLPLKLFLILLFLSISAYGQQHLCFEGIPIDGSLAEFTNAMIEKGYKHEATYENMAFFSGEFFNIEDCIIGVRTLKDYDVVFSISVFLPELPMWDLLIMDYKYIKNKLIDQYGWPKSTKEQIPPHIADSSKTILQALKRDEFYWNSGFSTPLGYIKLSIIAVSEYDYGQVHVKYYDAINSDPDRKEAMDDL